MSAPVRLTERQAHVLHVVEENGPVTPRDVDYSGFVASVAAARSLLSALEAKRCIEATYTTGEPGRAFVVTDLGTAALAAYFAEAGTS